MGKSNKNKKNNVNKNTTKKGFDNMTNLFKNIVIAKEHVYKGNKNVTEFKDFVDLCKMSQLELKFFLSDELREKYETVIEGDGFVYAKGSIPILLTAHMDTVHKDLIKDFYEYTDENGNHILSSPQGIGGDDRCGIYMILEIIKELNVSVLFCEDEEIGGIGSNKFCKTEYIDDLKNMKYLIELDRMNGNDAVFYDCDNDEFTKFITSETGYKKSWGSFSDISHLSPACKVASVNLSCGYYHAHTLEEEVNVEEMLNTIEVVKKLVSKWEEQESYEYIEKEYTCFGRYNGGYHNYSSVSKSTNLPKTMEMIYILEVLWYDNEDNEQVYTTEGSSEYECWYSFFMENPDVCFNDIYDYNLDEI